MLNWSAEGEVNTKYFTVEKSFDRVSFTSLTNIAASGNTQANNYQYSDRSSINGICYYRLKMADADGRFTYSKIIAISTPVNNAITIFPNPVKDQLFIRLTDGAGATEVSVADSRGAVIKRLQHRLELLKLSLLLRACRSVCILSPSNRAS